MPQTKKQRALTIVVQVVVPLLAGLVVLLILYPGLFTNATIPLQCFSILSFRVPCEDGVNVAAGAATAVLVAVVLWLRDHRK